MWVALDIHNQPDLSGFHPKHSQNLRFTNLKTQNLIKKVTVGY
jgi:hypothetical protein